VVVTCGASGIGEKIAFLDIQKEAGTQLVSKNPRDRAGQHRAHQFAIGLNGCMAFSTFRPNPRPALLLPACRPAEVKLAFYILYRLL
jgi:hypothetical protein